jgi:chloramphenicol-sensitive protein RarD
VSATPERGRGLAALFGAFGIWGLLPLYLRFLRGVPPTQIMAHRLVWCCVVVLGWLAAAGQTGLVRRALMDRATRARLTATAALISINWLVYVWAVATGHVIEASLGYFVNPLVNVLLGVVVLRERLNRVQWTAIAIAASGVCYLTWLGGRPPWIALVLAVSFGTYGLLRKTVSADALVGLGTETLIIAPLGAAYLVFAEASGHGGFSQGTLLVRTLLLLGGPLTAVPLALFAFGARRVPYATVGLIQYLGPSLQLLLGVRLFHEPFTESRAIGFGLIWAALALYAADGLRRR